ncbi:hypothetical protein GCM10020254_55080 [Streptomyces goshikiensis]
MEATIRVPSHSRAAASPRGGRGDDRAEEGHVLAVGAGHRDDRGADLLADPVDAVVVGGAQHLVVLVGVGVREQLGRQVEGGQRLRDHLAGRAPALVVDAGAELGVQLAGDLVAELLLRGDDDAHRRPALGAEQLAVALGQLVELVLVQDGEAHHVPADLDVADLLDLQHPAGRHPGPGGRAGRTRSRPGVFSRTWVSDMSLLGWFSASVFAFPLANQHAFARIPPWEDALEGTRPRTKECTCPERICPVTRPASGPSCCPSTGTRWSSI